MPFDVEGIGTEIVRLHNTAEVAVVSLVTEMIARDISGDVVDVNLVELNARATNIARELSRETGSALITAINEAYDIGDAAAIEELMGIAEARFTGSRALNALLTDARARINSTHFAIVRQADDVYSRVVSEVAGRSVVGVATRREVAQQALNRFADLGIRGFVDRTGHSWNLTTYAEMATRTVTMRAAVQGHTERLVSKGYDLAIISGHFGSCDMCSQWEGVVVSQSGTSPHHPSLSDAIGDGLFHPNFGHSVSAYIEDVTRPLELQPDVERNAEYEARQQQRYHERQIRKWQRREVAAIDPQAREYSQNKLREWQSRQTEHLRTWNLRRKPEREAITGAR